MSQFSLFKHHNMFSTTLFHPQVFSQYLNNVTRNFLPNKLFVSESTKSSSNMFLLWRPTKSLYIYIYIIFFFLTNSKNILMDFFLEINLRRDFIAIAEKVFTLTFFCIRWEMWIMVIYSWKIGIPDLENGGNFVE